MPGRDGDSIEEAARAWAAAKSEQQRAQVTLKALAPRLLAYFAAHPEARDVAGVVGVATYSRVLWDRQALRARLGDELARFQSRRTYRSLALLAEPTEARASEAPSLSAAAPPPTPAPSARRARRSSPAARALTGLVLGLLGRSPRRSPRRA